MLQANEISLRNKWSEVIVNSREHITYVFAVVET